MNEVLSETIKELVLPVLTKEDTELVELLINRGRRKLLLRFLVDKAGGITLDECARLNKEIGRMLDEQNIVQESYVLEVCSPGLDRSLKATRDFQRVQGELVKIVLHQPLNGQNVWKGSLVEVNDENVTIQTEHQQKLCIPRSIIARANLEVRI